MAFRRAAPSRAPGSVAEEHLGERPVDVVGAAAHHVAAEEVRVAEVERHIPVQLHTGDRVDLAADAVWNEKRVALGPERVAATLT